MKKIRKGFVALAAACLLSAAFSCVAAAAEAKQLTIKVPEATEWVDDVERGKRPYGEPKVVNLKKHTDLSGELAWSMTAGEHLGALLGSDGNLAVRPECGEGAVMVEVSNGEEVQTLKVVLDREKPYCWGGSVLVPYYKVEAPAKGEEALQKQCTLTIYDQYGGVVAPSEYKASWRLLDKGANDWNTEYKNYKGINIDDNGLMTIPSSAPNCELWIRVQLDKWKSQSCQSAILVINKNAEPEVYWEEPGWLAWDPVKGAEQYMVMLLDENGERIGNNRTKDPNMEMFSFMGWNADIASGEYKVVVEPRDKDDDKMFSASGKRDYMIDSGLSIKVNVEDRKLSYSVEKKTEDTYKLRVREPISAGDVLLDTWRSIYNSAQCTRHEFSRGENRYVSSERTVRGDSQEVRLISDSRIRDGKVWEFDLTAVEKAPPVAKVIRVEIGSATVEVDGRRFENDVPPVVKNGRTFLPIRVVAENLGATVGWNGKTQSVTIEKDGKMIEVPIGKQTVWIDGKTVELEQAAFVEKGRTYLPLRFVSENLGAEVVWDAKNSQARIIQML